jgi:LysM repeat protein
LVSLARPAEAAEPADPIIYIVQPGDSLYQIGLRYGVNWIDIMQANNLTGSIIYSGQQLIIPLNEPAPAPTPSPTDDPPADNPPPAPPPAEATTYTVQRGDILNRIAQRFGVTVSALASANNLVNPSLIYAGQVLIIPGPNDTSDDSAGAPPPPSGSNKLILVDISEQRMYVYQDNALVWQWVVSTGEPGLDTQPGSYTVLDKIPNAYAATWNLWMPNWLGIYWAGYLENGIHALPILWNGARLWDGYLGTKVSFGCIILGVDEAQTLFDWAEVGTTVTIQE